MGEWKEYFEELLAVSSHFLIRGKISLATQPHGDSRPSHAWKSATLSFWRYRCCYWKRRRRRRVEVGKLIIIFCIDKKRLEHCINPVIWWELSAQIIRNLKISLNPLMSYSPLKYHRNRTKTVLQGFKHILNTLCSHPVTIITGKKTR